MSHRCFRCHCRKRNGELFFLCHQLHRGQCCPAGVFELMEHTPTIRKERPWSDTTVGNTSLLHCTCVDVIAVGGFPQSFHSCHTKVLIWSMRKTFHYQMCTFSKWCTMVVEHVCITDCFYVFWWPHYWLPIAQLRDLFINYFKLGKVKGVVVVLTVDVLPDRTDTAPRPVLLSPDPAARYFAQLARRARGGSAAFRSPRIPQQVQVPELPVIPLADPAEQRLALSDAAYSEADGGGDGTAVHSLRGASPLLSTQSLPAAGIVRRFSHGLLFVAGAVIVRGCGDDRAPPIHHLRCHTGAVCFRQISTTTNRRTQKGAQRSRRRSPASISNVTYK